MSVTRTDRIESRSGKLLWDDQEGLFFDKNGKQINASMLLTEEESELFLTEIRSLGKNILTFGATGSGILDDTEAFKKALEEVGELGGLVILPAGMRFRITEKIKATSKPVNFIGGGSSSSIIFADNCDAFEVDNSSLSDKERASFTKIGFETNANGTYTAIDYKGKPGSSLGAQLTVSYCSFTGTSNQTCWNYPIKMQDGKFSEVSSNFFRGNTSDFTKTSASVYINDSTDVKIKGNFCYWSDYGVLIEGFSEGITVSDSHFVPVNRGVSHRGTGNLVWVKDNHISANLVGVELGNTGVPSVNHCQINNNLIFKRTNSTSNFVGVSSYSSRNSIMGNEVMIPGGSSASGTQNGIVLYADSKNCRVIGNTLANMDTGILTQSGSDSNTVSGNNYISCNNDFINNGTNTNSGVVNRTSLLGVDSNFSVNDSELTPVVWDTAEQDFDNLWSVSDKSRLNVPSKATKVKLSANISFNPDSTGERLVEIRKNGTLNAIGLSSVRKEAIASSDTSLSTSVINVNPGDYFQVYVRQTSGGSLDVKATGTTWFSLEVME